jgi:hypothetical protein
MSDNIKDLVKRFEEALLTLKFNPKDVVVTENMISFGYNHPGDPESASIMRVALLEAKAKVYTVYRVLSYNNETPIIGERDYFDFSFPPKDTETLRQFFNDVLANYRKLAKTRP